MEKASGRVSGRSQVFAVPPSPRLVRSRSGSSPAAITTPERSSRRFSSSDRFINGHRSKSTSRSRSYKDEDDNIRPTLMTSISSTPPTTVCQEYNRKKSSRDGFRKLLKRGVSPDNAGASRGAMPTVMKVPSAWALSPGRASLGSPIPVGGYESPAKANGGGGGVTNKVLKYFKQRKVSPMQEEEYHRFRILHNKLLQWRFINARAQIAMASVKNVAEIQLFSIWIKTLMVRKIVIQKRIELQKVKHLIKLYQILNPQLSFLNEWEKLKRRNHESIVSLIRKLSALSTTLPLTHNLKVDTQSVCEALNTAIKVMDNIEPVITRFQGQAERILYQVTELITASKQEEYLHELMRIVPMITTLLENEKSILVHLIQTKMEPNIGNHVCSIGQ